MGTVKGMLEHSRTSTAERPPANLNKLAEEYLRLAYQGLRAKDKTSNVELKTDFDPAWPRVAVESQPGQGTEFLITLPA